MKTCRKCKIEKDLSEFSKCSQYKDGLQNECKSCNARRAKNYGWTPWGKESRRKSAKRYYKKHPHKVLAQGKVHHAVSIGELERPYFCESCGLFADIEGHHPDYSKPLEVDWLCVPCHVKEHADLVLTPEI